MGKLAGSTPEVDGWIASDQHDLSDGADDTVWDVSANDNRYAKLRGYYVNVSPSHDVTIKQGSTAKFTIPAGTTPGFEPVGDVEILDDIVLSPNASESAANITLIYNPYR